MLSSRFRLPHHSKVAIMQRTVAISMIFLILCNITKQNELKRGISVDNTCIPTSSVRSGNRKATKCQYKW
eukprot:4554612-Amphidinium_carterae.2